MILPSWKLAVSKLYYSPGSSAAFSSAGKLFHHLKELGYKGFSLENVQQWLNEQYTYQVHKQRRVTFSRNPIISQRIDYIWEADILFLFDLANYNDRYPCILVCIDVVSRHAWVEPMRTKQGSSTSKAIEKIFAKSGRIPRKLHTDKGTEFYNKEFKSVMDKHNIILYSTESDKKAAIAERFIKELKKLIYRYLDSKQTNRYIDVLQKLVDSYNNTLHSSIGMKPKDVSNENEGNVLNTLYGHLWQNNTLMQQQQPKFKRGDIVRISLSRHPFGKGYKKVWSDELFAIDEVKLYSPFPMYKIRETTGEGDIIEGLFYDRELQHVPLNARKFHSIHTIFKTKIVKNKKWGLVNWTDAPNIKRWVRL